MGLLESYSLRWQRKRYHLRALRKRRELSVLADRTAAIRTGDILLFATLRNERARLPYFLRYYRERGVERFLIVDNGSEDGSADYLAAEPDVSVWTTRGSYRQSRFGIDWINWLQRRHGHGHWTLTVDADEFLVYPFCDTRPLRALTDWLDSAGVRSFGALILDMYPQGPLDDRTCREGQDPFEIAGWFDSGNYTISRNHRFGNLWIQGGPRARGFFGEAPPQAPALNKVPLVRWNRAYAYASSTHMLLPRGLNRVYEENGGEKASGCLLHAKLLGTLPGKAEEELSRHQHFRDGVEYRAYHAGLRDRADLWTAWSEKYMNWRQLELLGLMSKGNWA